MPPEQENEGPLERMRKRLYARKSETSVTESELPTSVPNAPEHWQAPTPPPAVAKPHMSGAALFLVGAAGFFALAGLVTGITLFLGGRTVSVDRADILVEGPASVAGGEKVSLLITIKNNNPVAMTGATLTVRFPEGTTEAEDTSVALAQHTEEVGDIPAGGMVRKTVSATFFGSENQKLSIPVDLEYHTQNSNAVFVKKETYDLTVSTSPIGLSITTLSEVSSGQPFTLSILVRSNARTPLENVAVRAVYPSGFVAKEATPEPLNGTLFSLGTLAAGEEREIRVSGTLLGQDGDERVFRFEGGALKSATVFIAKPFFAVDLSLNSDDAPIIVSSEGGEVVGFLAWTNALSSAIRDGSISVALSGDALDPESVSATNGFYRSSDRTIVFDRESADGLALLNPGDTGNGSFSFRVKSGNALTSLRNPSITLTVSVAGRRVGEGNVSENVSSTLTRTIKIQSGPTLSMESVRTKGPYANTGPWPPKVDTESTYTIQLSSKNTVNSLGNTAATMTLPSYVRYVAGETGVAYNESTRQVTWTVGDLAAGGTKTAAFQVALLPSLSQKGTSPVLVSEARLSGFDRFVQKNAETSAPSVSTDTKTDPANGSDKGRVIQ